MNVENNPLFTVSRSAVTQLSELLFTNLNLKEKYVMQITKNIYIFTFIARFLTKRKFYI